MNVNTKPIDGEILTKTGKTFRYTRDQFAGYNLITIHFENFPDLEIVETINLRDDLSSSRTIN